MLLGAVITAYVSFAVLVVSTGTLTVPVLDHENRSFWADTAPAVGLLVSFVGLVMAAALGKGYQSLLFHDAAPLLCVGEPGAWECQQPAFDIIVYGAIALAFFCLFVVLCCAAYADDRKHATHRRPKPSAQAMADARAMGAVR